MKKNNIAIIGSGFNSKDMVDAVNALDALDAIEVVKSRIDQEVDNSADSIIRIPYLMQEGISEKTFKNKINKYPRDFGENHKSRRSKKGKKW